MNKPLKGAEKVTMTPLPIYPKAFKRDSFVFINSKPKIFQASSYEHLNSVFSMDPLAPGLKKNMKQNSSYPSSHSLHFSTLENWEKLARTRIQGPVVQSFVSLTSLLMTNLLTVVAKVFSNTLLV